jgi:transcriptional regulator with XRE-family HTH domain
VIRPSHRITPRRAVMSSHVPDRAANPVRVLNPSATIAVVDTQRDDTGVPAREITVNQVAAWNIARYRRAAGLTQEQLGARVGWSGESVSQAERSFQPASRTRELDAQTLAVLALALGVPLTALFLPPDDDGTAARYVIAGGRGERYGMGDYMTLAVTPDGDDDTPAFDLYRERFNAAAARYLAPEWAAAVGRWTRGARTPAARADLAARLRDRAAAQRQFAADDERLADEIEEDGR